RGSIVGMHTMELQTPPAVAAAAGPQDGPVAGNVLTKDKLHKIVLAIQAMRARGATEQNNEEYAKLMQIVRYVTAQQQQQQQQQQRSEAVSDAKAESQPATPTAATANGVGTADEITEPSAASEPSAAPEPAPVVASALEQVLVPVSGASKAVSRSPAATVPELAPAGPAAASQPPQFMPDDIARLRKQIQAFRLVSKNMPLPAQLRQELWASAIPADEKRLLDAPPSGLDTAGGSVVEVVHTAVEQQREIGAQTQAQPQTQTHAQAPAKTPAVGVQLALPALPQDVGFVSPHALLREKLAATGEQGTRLQQLLVPSITPGGIDVRAMAQERERRREARIEYRIKELAALPATVSDEQLDVGAAAGQEFMRPGLVACGGGSSARLKALIELKALGLRHKQRALRTEVVRSVTRASQLGVAGDRSALRRMKKQSQREARLTEKMERQQRQERERREQDQHKQQLQAITGHGAGLVAWHRAQQQRMERLGRAVQALHVRIERDEAKRRERLEAERIQALKMGDEEAYLKLVDMEKDTRITHLLHQTDEYLTTLVAAVERQQRSARALDDAALGGGGGEDAPSWLKDNADMDTDDAGSAQSKDYYKVAHRIREEIRQQPGILVGGSLKEYQLRGLEWMVSLYNNRLNGILADEMGLGKTIQTISLVTYLIERKQQSGPFLIAVPLSTITNWLLEFEKWAPTVRVIGYKGNPAQRRGLQQQIRRHDFQVLLTTYEYIIKDRPILAKINWVHVIIDEGHRLKNASARLPLTLSTYYKTRFRLILTGTPLQNNLPELWALLNFVLPNIFSSAQSFDEWFNAPFASTGGQDRMELTEEEQLLIIRRLHKVLRPFLLRRLKKDVEVDLPDKREHVIWCGMSAVQSRLYTQMLRFGTLFRGVRADGGSTASKASFNNTLMQLRKICNHPFIFEEVESRINPTSTNNSLLYRTAGKFELVDRVLAKMLATNHKVLIFFQMTQIMTIMQDFLEWRGIASLRLDGSTADDDRREYMRIFNTPGTPFKVFLLSTRAGGQGLNLQTADTVILFDSDWNPSADAQATDRAHRIGQTNEVRVLRLITRGTIEESILERAESKRVLDGKVIQAGKFDNKTTPEEREQILRSLLKASEAEDADEVEDTANSDEELNDLLARSEEERVIFARLDQERAARELHEWRAAGHTDAPPERLFAEAELPEEYLHDYDPEAERRQAEEAATRDKSRSARRVFYDDGLSEEQWLDAMENDNIDLEDVIRKNRDRQERRQRRREEKLLQQHLRTKLGDGAPDGVGDEDDDDDDDDGPDMDGGLAGGSDNDAAARGTPRKKSRARRAGSGAVSAAHTPAAPASGDSGTATPSAAHKAARKRPRPAAELDGDGDGDGVPASGTGTGTATPAAATAGTARKARRKTGAADLLPPEQRARLDGIFEAAFAAVEACADPEYGRRRCDLFLELPSRRDYPDYYVIIRTPIAMKAIRRNVKAHRYASVADFHRDWKLMFDNARTYNEEGSMVYDDACALQRALEGKLSEATGDDYATPMGAQLPLPAAGA
ncbi:ATP-dependent DNA helicase Snf21, partial [Coemansia biformis]